MMTRNPDYQAAVQRLFDGAAFVAGLGIHPTNVAPGRCETQLVITPSHCQQDGYVHAGALATIADHTAGAAATTVVAANEYVLTAEFKINFLYPAMGNCLRCRSQVLKPGRQLIVAESEVYILGGDQTRLVAKALLTLAVLDRTRRGGLDE